MALSLKRTKTTAPLVETLAVKADALHTDEFVANDTAKYHAEQAVLRGNEAATARRHANAVETALNILTDAGVQV